MNVKDKHGQCLINSTSVLAITYVPQFIIHLLQTFPCKSWRSSLTGQSMVRLARFTRVLFELPCGGTVRKRSVTTPTQIIAIFIWTYYTSTFFHYKYLDYITWWMYILSHFGRSYCVFQILIKMTVRPHIINTPGIIFMVHTI